MSKQRNNNKRSKSDPSSIFLCQDMQCLQSHQCNPTLFNKVSKTDIAFKKKLMCHHCGTSWFICTLCNIRFNRNYAVTHHFTKYHKISSTQCTTSMSTAKEPKGTEINFSNDCNSSTSSLSFEHSTPYTNTCMASEHHTVNTSHVLHANMSEPDKAYFTSEIGTPGEGFQNLVAKSVLNVSHSSLSTAETLYHLDVAKFCTGLNGSQQVHFARIMQQTCNREIFTSSRPPHCLHDIHAFYTRSKTSILNALPSPPIHTTQYHTYISLISVIDYFLAYGHTPDYLTNNDDITTKRGISACPQAIKMRMDATVSSDITEDPMILYLLFWSDDFEGSMLRKNKNSVWLKTVTICPPHDQVTSTKYTYVIAIGRKGSDHDEINKLHNEELEQLNKCTYRYYGASNVRRNIPVIVKVMAVLADRPERSSMNYILQHNGTTTKRWRYAGNISIEHLPSCSRCFKGRINNMQSYKYIECQHCCDWNYNVDNQHIRQPLPEHYPTQQHTASPDPPHGRHVIDCTYLVPIEQTYTLLIAASKFCAFNFWSDTWSKKNVKAYMHSVGLSEKYYKPHIIDVHNAATQPVTSIMDKITSFYIPTMWTSTVTLKQYIDTPMHLIFQGIVKSVIEFSFLFLTHFKKQTNV